MTTHGVSPASGPYGRVVAVVGATAAGKSDLAVTLAQELDGEVINADSMQLYRGMDIGTAKLPRSERQGVPHHLLDIWPVTHPASVAEFQTLVRAQFVQLAEAGRTAVLVGGSGLYIRAALDDLRFPGTDEQLRAALEAELAAVGPGPLHERLRERDPAAAAAIEPANGRRIVRALEVGQLTGEPFQAVQPEPTYAVPAVQIGLTVARPELDERIARRADRMWEQGFVDEVRGLCEQGLREGPTASRALGYASVLRHLDGGLTSEEARAETVRLTRRFARRQESWFRRDARVTWLEAGATALRDAMTEISAVRPADLVGRLAGGR